MWNIFRLRRLVREESTPRLKELRFSADRIRRSPLSIIGISIILFFAALALLAPILAPPQGSNPYIIPRDGFSPTPKPPDETHPFGTTQGQYDIFYGVIWGTRTAFYVGFIVVGAYVVIGIALGSISGYYGGVVDETLMRTADIVFAFPPLILAMALVTAFGPSLESIILALILVGWPIYARIMRGEVLSVKEEDYVEAAKAIGGSDFRLILRHILPNGIYPLLIIGSLDVGAIVITEAALSFLGLGPPIGFADWGQMVSFSRNWIVGIPSEPFAFWYTYIIPGVFMFVFVLGWNLLGDAFRDILDPTLRRR